MKVTVSKHGEKWVVSRGWGNNRRRKSFTSEAKANAEAARWRENLREGDKVWDDLSADEQKRLVMAWQSAKQNGLDLGVIATQPHAKKQMRLGDVVEELWSVKKSSGRDEGYLDSMMVVLGQFMEGRRAQMIDQITVKDVEAFLDSKSLAYRSTLRARLSTLFNFAVRREYLIKNPCDQLETVIYHKPPPQIFTPDQLRKSLDWLRENPRGIAWFVLTSLCGLRPEEAQKTTRDKIRTDTGEIVIDTQTTKVRERRVVCPMKEAMACLKVALKIKGGELPLADQPKKRTIHRLRGLIGFERWPKDITRHTAASLWLARNKSAAEVSHQLGNSEKVLKRDYKAALTKKTVREFMKVLKDFSGK